MRQLSFVFGLWACCAAAPADEGGKVKWAKSLDAALAEAKQGNKLVMVDFYTTWCPPCKKLDAETYGDEKFAEYANAEIVSLKLDAEKEGAKAAEKYKVEAYPTILFLDGAGRPVGRSVGFIAAAPLVAKLKAVAKAAKEFAALAEAFAAKPGDAEAFANIGVALALRGDADELAAAAKKAEAAGLKGDGLAEACNKIGDVFQEEQKFPEAIAQFRKAADSGPVPRKAYALLSISACETDQRQFKAALKHVREALALEGVPDKLKKDADQQLQVIVTRRKQMAAQLDQQIKRFEAQLKAMREARTEMGDDEAAKDPG